MHGSTRMEEIMADIREHLLPVVDHGANGNVHHYNRVWEKIDRWHKKYASQSIIQADASNDTFSADELFAKYGDARISFKK